MGKRGTYTIEIGGEERSGRFTMGFWEILEQEESEPAGFLLAFTENITARLITSLFYCSLKYDALAQGKAFAYNRYQVAEWIDELQETEEGEKAISEVVNTFLDSRQVGKMVEAAEKITSEINKHKDLSEEEIKKKLNS